MPEDLLDWLWLDQGAGSSKNIHLSYSYGLLPGSFSNDFRDCPVNTTPSVYSLWTWSSILANPRNVRVEGIGLKLFLPYTEAMSFQVQVNLSPKILFEKPVVSGTIQRI